MRVKSFPALVPAPGVAAELASVPYDVINTEEARVLAGGKPHSFLRVERAELELSPETDPYSEAVYAHAKVNFEKMQREGIFREMKLRGHYEKPSEKKAREKAEAVRRARKLQRKKLQREGLLPMPKKVEGAPARGPRAQ